MRRLTKSERRTLTLFLVVMLIFLNIIGIRYYISRKQIFQSEVEQLSIKDHASKILVKELEFWKQRKEWLDAHQPGYSSSGDAGSHLIQTAMETANNFNLTIQNQPLIPQSNPDNSSPTHQEVTVQIKFLGTLEAFTRWISELQQPEHFIAVTSLSLKSDIEPNMVTGELQAVLWYTTNPTP